jgi:hypothetical protein
MRREMLTRHAPQLGADASLSAEDVAKRTHTSARRSIQRGRRRLQVLHELGAGARPSAEDADKRTLPPPAAACSAESQLLASDFGPFRASLSCGQVQIGVAPGMLLTALNQSQNGVLLKLINRMPLATMVLLSAQHTRQLRIGHNVAGAMQ